MVPTYPPGYPAFYTQQQLGGSSVPIGVAVPSSPAVPMGIWSDSSSPHGQSLHATFNHYSSPAPNPSNFNRGPIQPVPSPSPAGGGHEVPFVESDEDDEDDDNFSPFCPTIQGPSASAAPTTTGLLGQASNHPLGEVTNAISNGTEPDPTNVSEYCIMYSIRIPEPLDSLQRTMTTFSKRYGTRQNAAVDLLVALQAVSVPQHQTKHR